jgi:hypothetical protein
MRKIRYTAEEWAGLATNETQQWQAYLASLASMRYRRFRMDQLYLMLVRQNFKCALSGVQMTCKRERYVYTPTNASIDRIVPGSAYRMENVQLVCMQINIMKRRLSVDEFINRCHVATEKRIANEWQVLVSEFNPVE